MSSDLYTSIDMLFECDKCFMRIVGSQNLVYYETAKRYGIEKVVKRIDSLKHKFYLDNYCEMMNTNREIQRNVWYNVWRDLIEIETATSKV